VRRRSAAPSKNSSIAGECESIRRLKWEIVLLQFQVYALMFSVISLLLWRIDINETITLIDASIGFIREQICFHRELNTAIFEIIKEWLEHFQTSIF